MDEQQLRQIIREVLRIVGEGGNLTSNVDSSLLPKAYFVFPKNWQNCKSDLYIPALKAAEGKYQRVIVLPERSTNEDCFSEVGEYQVTTYGDLGSPAEGSVTIFPIPNRDLIIKVALCFSEDFESGWIRQCIENGLRVYMKKEPAMFTGKEPAAYRKKILSYYQDVKSYGICFSEDDDSCKNITKSAEAGTKAKAQTKARYITTQDLRNVPQNGEFRIHTGDILTALAKEYVEKFSIQIVEE